MVNEQLFYLIYNEHKNLVYNLSLNYVLNIEDAQDITQEVFIKVYNNLHLYNNEKASYKTWIYRITVNYCLDFIKAKKKKKRFGFISALFNLDTNEPITDAINSTHPGIEAEDKEAINNLLHLISTLPESQKTAIILSKIEDRNQKEIAEIMNTTVKAVESLLQRAKVTLQKKIDNAEGF